MSTTNSIRMFDSNVDAATARRCVALVERLAKRFLRAGGGAVSQEARPHGGTRESRKRGPRKGGQP